MMTMMWGTGWRDGNEGGSANTIDRKRFDKFVGMGYTVVLGLAELPEPSDLLRTLCVLMRFWSNGVS